MSTFLFHPGIKGEATDRNHKEWVEADIIQWGSDRQITFSTSTRGDRESSNATISDLTLYRYMDKASPYIFMLACCGTGKDVEIHLTKTGKGGGADVYMVYMLKNALISHYNVQAKGKSVLRPYEEIHISFTAISIRYTPYDEDGNMTASIAMGFDTATNTKI